MDAEYPDILERQNQRRIKNLEWANKVRIAQAELKRRLRLRPGEEGFVDPIVMLDGHDPMWSRFALEIKVGVMLNAIPGLGRSTVHELLLECGLFPEDRLKNATPEQRERLVQLIRMLFSRE